MLEVETRRRSARCLVENAEVFFSFWKEENVYTRLVELLQPCVELELTAWIVTELSYLPLWWLTWVVVPNGEADMF